jgi:hypothetical protein
MIASLLGDSKPVRAQTITGSVPEVDRVSVRVVIDSYQFAVAAGKKMRSSVPSATLATRNETCKPRL